MHILDNPHRLTLTSDDSYDNIFITSHLSRIAAILVLGVVSSPLFAQQTSSGTTPSQDATVQELEKQVQTLSQKVDDLEGQQDKDEKEVKGSQNQRFQNAATVTAGPDGFSIQSADQQFKLRLGTLLQADDREFLTPTNNGGSPGDGFELRRARIIFDGTVWGAYQFRIEPEFGSRTGGAGGTSTTTATLANASVNVDYWEQLQFLAGRFKGPVGYERSQLVADNIWIENGLTQNLTSQYTQGFLAHGDVDHNLLAYGAGVNESTRDNANGDFQGMIDNNYDFIGDVYLNPFVNTGNKSLEGLGFGVAGSVGNRGDVKTAANAPLAAYTTPGQTNILTYNTNGTQSEDGPNYRFTPVIYYYNGPFGGYADYALSSIRDLRTVGTASRTATFTNEAWQVVGSYVLTGEDASYAGVKPRSDFSFRDHTWGAFQLVGRFGEMTLDNNYFTSTGAATTVGGAFVTQGPRIITNIGAGLNWYLNSNVKAQFEYDYDGYTGGNLTVNPENEDQNSFLTQLQLAF
jgi:phosphate-selective porin OprO and OprP